MREAEFRKWLINVDKRSKAQVSDNISRIRRIEKVFSDLEKQECNVDFEYEKDKCVQLMEKLSLENRKNYDASINLPQDSGGLGTLRTSLRKYIAFINYYMNEQTNA